MTQQKSNDSQQQKNVKKQKQDKSNTDYSKYMDKPNHPNT